MKNLILILISSFSFAQVAIGKNPATVTNNSVSLEFGSGTKGIVLPYVEDKSGISATDQGSLILDTTNARVKLKTATGWFDYSSENPSDAAHNGQVDLSAQTSLQEKAGAKVIIGANSSDANGLLVLESANKAMILPQIVAPELNIVKPASGMMVYDPNRKVLAVFNGKEWSYWEGVNN